MALLYIVINSMTYAFDHHHQTVVIYTFALVPLVFSGQIGGLIDEAVVTAKNLVKATSREIEKWR